MRKIVLFGFLFSITLILQSSVYAQVDKNWLDKKVKFFLQDKPVNGMIYGLWINGKAISVSAYGESMTAVPAHVDMHFRIGGVTETMISTILMQMVEQGRVNLDDKIAPWYPELPYANEVSLRMLANCTSGYPDYVYNKKFDKLSTDEPFKQWTDQELLDFAFMDEPLFTPGSSQHYSHTDYVILGSILRQIAGKSLNSLLQSNILTPLGMKETQFNRTAKMKFPVLHSFTNVRSIFEDATFWDPSWTSSSGSTVSTIRDLGLWGRAFSKGTLVSAKSTEQLRAPDTVGKGTNRADLYFAMGFVVANHWLVQNPAFGGYSGVFAVLPEKNIVFIAYNTLNEKNKTNENLSFELWKSLANELAPAYPLPKF